MHEIRQEDLPAGTIIRKVYRGEVHLIEVAQRSRCNRRPLTDFERRNRMWRYVYRGERYRSLSAVAYKITGQRYRSGHHFFGLRKVKHGSRTEGNR